jgi:hypothetical protein
MTKPLGMTKERTVVTVEDSFHGLNRLRKNSRSGRKDVPQGLKPDVFSIIYGTTKVMP